MNILYLCNFDIQGYAGKNRATGQKLSALKKQVDNLTIVSAKFKNLKFLELFLLEIKAIYLIFNSKPDVIISRGFVGYFVQKIAKYKNIKTVREIHADILSEIDQTSKHWIAKKLIYPLALYAQKVDNQADIRIFNHPDLKKWYKDKIQNFKNDIYVYNGFDYKVKSKLTNKQAREKFNFTKDKKYLVFTGSASYWHGVDYLVYLQKELNKLESTIQIVCGGGKVSKDFDPEEILINITPLDDKGCADLVQASDACVLPVRQSRVSPGSPLKLYDYILHKKFIITQENLNGYSDEVRLYEYGLCVDFTQPQLAALKIYEKLKSADKKIDVDISKFSWDNRIKQWLKGISK